VVQRVATIAENRKDGKYKIDFDFSVLTDESQQKADLKPFWQSDLILGTTRATTFWIRDGDGIHSTKCRSRYGGKSPRK
jgi:hypothetical protein